MNTQKTKKLNYAKAWIALAAAVSCFLIYALACVLSPVTWSPDSSKIAMLVTPPGDDPNMFAIFSYDIATGERVLLDEVKADGILSAPAWSPDGKWIAYYKVEPSPPEEPAPPPQADPNATASTDKSTEEAGAKIEVEKVLEEAEAKEVAEELFSEENRMLLPFLSDIDEEKMEEDEDRETFDVKLMVERPDGKERKILRVMKWEGDEEVRKLMVFIRPEWSKDSKHLFYARFVKEVYYIASLNIATGEANAHLFSSIGTPAASPDGKWVASLLQTDPEQFLLTLAGIDGRAQKYFKLDLDFDDEEFALAATDMSWSPDSKRILISVGEEFCLVDSGTGNLQKYHDPNTESIGCGIFSPDGNKLYYIAEYESPDPNSTEGEMRLMYMNLEDRKTETVFEISEFPEVEKVGKFSVSPNGKMVLLRCVMEDEQGNEKSALIFWDGKTQKIVETDRWLIETAVCQ